jgi:hypothetical protein
MRRWIGGVSCATLAAFMGGGFALAASAPTASPNSTPGQGLEISPPVIELTANPGQTLTTQIRVLNVTTGTLLVKGEADDFGAGSGEDGSPEILLHEQGATRYSLKYWISGVPDLQLAPQEIKSVPVTIHVPANGEPGGHYAVVRFTGVPAGLNGTGVSLSASVGALILLRVNGPITEKLSTVQFSAGTQGKTAWTSKSFFEYGPIDFLVRLQDQGTVHELPQGSITVKNMLGSTVGTVVVNPLKGNILPDSIRRFVQTLHKKALFGYYTASLSLTYAGGKTLKSSTSFWVIPWLLILLVLVGLVVFVYLLRVGIKKYNEHIIAMARRRR